MTKYITTCTFLFILSANVFAEVNLEIAAICDRNPATKSQEQLKAGATISSVYKSNSIDAGRCLGWTNLGAGSIWYDVSKGLTIHAVDVSKSTYLGHWPITRWPHEYIPPELTQRLAQERAYDMSPNPEATELQPDELYEGCLSKLPLRYGDIDNNGSQELVLFLDQDIVIFSPQQQKTILQLRWIDERYEGDYQDEGSAHFEPDPEYSRPVPQYRDAYVYGLMDETGGPLYSGLRSYAKLYLGEFNGNTTPDILVWHKVYESNMENEAAGFHKVRDVYLHYELITNTTDGIIPTGEYLPMKTSEPTVQQWLSSKNQTWQKGYPNLSECEGQTDQHIPEMIDPLLNDPEVLN